MSDVKIPLPKTKRWEGQLPNADTKAFLLEEARGGGREGETLQIPSQVFGLNYLDLSVSWGLKRPQQSLGSRVDVKFTKGCQEVR